MSEINGSTIANILADDVLSFESMATNFSKSRFLVLASEFGSNEKEAAEIQKLADAVQCAIKQDGAGFSLDIDYLDNSNYFEIIQNGMQAPVAGGSGGVAHNPDGSTYQSAVPPQLWGNTLDSLAKDGIDITGEIKMMLTGLFRDHVQSAVSSHKSDIAALAKESELKQLQL